MSQSSADRNLLFGILALQLDFINRDALIAAMQAWVFDKTRPLGQILVGQAKLGQDEHALLEALVRKHLERHGDNAEQSLKAVSSVGPVREELRQIADAEVQASVLHVAVAPQGAVDPYPTRAPSVGTPTSSGQRFRILRPHARGGLGEVYVAHDEELRREVALKEIQDRFADEPESRSRFLLEAEITGGLEHPGIVPVYGLGQYADGRPFYAMRFIKGDSLKEAIERFHQAEGAQRDPGERSLALRKLLGRFIDVCNAIAYAHSRGVLHRDLKPGNIMLGKYGETLVVDWGLAKAVGRQANEPASEQPIRPSASSGTAETLPGSALGTPQYMSPEQAAGRLDQLGPASDVYSLGATLYCLLTGQAPFPNPQEIGLGESLRKVQKGDLPRPRQLNRTVHPALEAICLKAMALKPDDRYSSPRLLAEDLEHWLADAPVSAYQEPWLERLGRWIRQHKTQVGTAASIGVVGITIAIAFTLVTSATRQKEKEHDLRGEANRQREEADIQRVRAEAEKGEAERQREKAQRLRAIAECWQYDADMKLAQRAWHDDQIESMDRILEMYRPGASPNKDRITRGFEWHYLERLRHESVILPWSGSENGVTLTFSPDGHRLAVLEGGDRPTAILYDPGIRQELSSCDHVICLAFSPDSRLLAAGLEDGSVHVWNAVDGKENRVFRGHAAKVLNVVFRPDSQQLASADDDKRVKVWDLATSEPRDVFTLNPFVNEMKALAFSPDGRILAAGTYEKVCLWDLVTGTERLPAPIQQLGATFSDVRFSADGQRLIASAYTLGPYQTLIVHNLRTRTDLLSLSGQACAVLSPDCRLAASIGVVRKTDFMGGEKEENDNTVKIWDATTGRELRAIKGDGELHRAEFSPDGRFVGSQGDGSLTAWDVQTGEQRFSNSKDVRLIGFSPDGQRLAYREGHLGTIMICEAVSGDVLSSLKGHTSDLESEEFSPDGRRLATASWDKTIRLWDLTARQDYRQLRGPNRPVESLVFSPDGRRLAWANADTNEQTLQLWDPASGEELRSLAKAVDYHLNEVTRLAFRPDGERIASAAGDLWDQNSGKKFPTSQGPPGEPLAVVFRNKCPLGALYGNKGLILWDLVSGQVIHSLGAYPDGVGKAVFSPEGDRLAVAADDKTETNDGDLKHRLDIWDVDNGTLLYTLKDQPGSAFVDATPMAFSPDGRLLASVQDRTIWLWDAAGGAAIRPLQGHSHLVECLTFSPDGQRLASGGMDDLVKVWDLETGQELLSMAGHGTRVTSVAFSRDGLHLASGDGGGDVLLWDATRTAAAFEQRGLLWQREQAATAEKDGHWFAAAFHVSRLIEMDPNDGTLYKRRAQAYEQLKEWDKVLEDCNKATALKAGDEGIQHLREEAENLIRLKKP